MKDEEHPVDVRVILMDPIFGHQWLIHSSLQSTEILNDGYF